MLTRRILLCLILLLCSVSTLNSAPKPTYLFWRYDFDLTLNDTEYLLRNWKYNHREDIYYAEYTHEGLGHWFNAPFKFNTELGGVVGETDTLPEWAVGLPDKYDWK